MFKASEAYELSTKVKKEKEYRQAEATSAYITNVVEPAIKKACNNGEMQTVVWLKNSDEFSDVNAIRLENELKLLGGYEVAIQQTRNSITAEGKVSGNIAIEISWGNYKG